MDHERGGYLAGARFVARRSVAFIVVYKRDLHTVDQLCLALAVDEPGDDGLHDAVHIEEDNPDYEEVLADIEAHFALPEGWWHEATRAPLATDANVIWRRGGQDL
ncbi:MAG: hypothetical protein KDE27_00360 [Planctomycetes bacterium]|nr:hypothetical protein [Planctomycetota bacterium]